MLNPEENFSEDSFVHRAKLDIPVNLGELHNERSLEFSMVSMAGEEDGNYEKHVTQNPEMYFKHDDLMKYVDLSVSVGTSDTDDNLSPFEKMKLSMTDITHGDGKVFKKVVKAGVGEICPPSSVVKFHYIAFRENEEVPYDISRLRRKFPESSQLGSNQLIPGLELGISTMRLNEESHFLIHSDYAYGDLGCGERIPPKASLLFKVELLAIEQLKVPENEEFENTQEEYSFEKLFQKARDHLAQGSLVKKRDKNNSRAIKEYRAAVVILGKTPLNSDEEEKMKRHLITKAYTNLAICYNDENAYTKACSAYNDAIYEGCEEAQNNAKLIYNFAKAQCGLHNFDGALKHFKRALALDPKIENRVNEALREITKKKKKSKEEEALICGRMFQLS